jgi:hypothetical protein
MEPLARVGSSNNVCAVVVQPHDAITSMNQEGQAATIDARARMKTE